MTKLAFALTSAVATLVLAGQTYAGPHCHPGAARYGTAKVAASRPVAAPRIAQSTKPATTPIQTAPADSIADIAAAGAKSVRAEPPIAASAAKRSAAAPIEAPAPAQTAESPDYTSVSGVAARLAALAAQQAADARRASATQ